MRNERIACESACSLCSMSVHVCASTLISDRSSIRKLRQDMEDVTAEYAGKKISRKQLEKQQWQDEEEDEQEADEDEEDAESADAAESHSNASAEHSDADDREEQEQMSDENEEEEEEGEDGEEERIEEDDDDDQDVSGDDQLSTDEGEEDDGAAISASMLEQQALVEKELQQLDAPLFQQTPGQSSTTSSQLLKAHHIAHQQSLQHALLNVRIRLQPILQSANALPGPDMQGRYIEADPSLTSPYTSAFHSLSTLLHSLVSIQRASIQTNDIWKTEQNLPTDGVGKKRKASELQTEQAQQSYMSSLYTSLHSLSTHMRPLYRDIIDKWNKRTQMSAGNVQAAMGGRAGAAHSDKQLKSLNQSILSQLDSMLQDKEGLRKRSQIQRNEYVLLGRMEKEKERREEEMEGEGDFLAPQLTQSPDSWLYDDTDLYAHQLQELLNTADIGGGAGAGGEGDIRGSLEKARKRVKKMTDTKASKGRKIKSVTTTYDQRLYSYTEPHLSFM